ncbi:MAG TPA: EamA family transporter [Terriglobales bacterium]|nr:EamA family transporter [Terriglobales bacterium]
MSATESRQRFLTILCFGLVYLFWGSTYLGIDIAIEHIPPALMCGVRFLAAGVIMLAYCLARGQSIRYSGGQMAQLATVGILLLMGGNLTLSYAEQYVPTGLAALLVAITPLWFLVLDSLLLGDHHISRRGMAGLALGAAGTVVLLWPQLRVEGLGRRELWHSISLLGGSFSWALGSVLSKRWQQGTSFSASAWQITYAGIANLVVALFLGDLSRVVWTARGLGAVLYLVVCGSIIGYTSYIWLLAHVPTSKVSTYAYVNPVVAVFLGWLVLHESIDRYIVAGSMTIVAAVVLVTSAKVHARRAEEELPAVEAVGD